MIPISPCCKASTGLTAPFYTTISYRAICIFFVTAFLLAWQVKAQEKAGQINDLVRQLQSQDAGVRSRAAEALGQIGPEAKEAVPTLIASLKDQDAAFALGQIGKEAVPALIASLKDQDADVRRNSAFGLGQIKEAVPALIASLKDQDADVRSHAAYALGFGSKKDRDDVDGSHLPGVEREIRGALRSLTTRSRNEQIDMELSFRFRVKVKDVRGA